MKEKFYVIRVNIYGQHVMVGRWLFGFYTTPKARYSICYNSFSEAQKRLQKCQYDNEVSDRNDALYISTTPIED